MGLLRCQPDVGIEPAKQGFAIGVAVIVEVGDGGGGRVFTEHRFAPGVSTGTLAGRQLKQPGGWELVSKSLPQLRPQDLIGKVNLIDDDALGLFELLAIDVLDMFGEPRAGSKAEDAGGPQRVEDHTEGSKLKPFPVQLLKGQADRGDQISTAADRLGQQDVSRLFPPKGFGCFQQ